MIIEFSGIPRSGKSTLTQRLEKDFSVHEEFFHLNPYDMWDMENYNLWYAKQVADYLEEAINTKQNMIFHRGAFDRLVFSKSLNEMQYISNDCYEKHLSLLSGLVGKTDRIIICDCSVEESLRRDKYKDNLTGNPEFLSLLRENYLSSGLKVGAKIVNTEDENSLKAFQLI